MCQAKAKPWHWVMPYLPPLSTVATFLQLSLFLGWYGVGERLAIKAAPLLPLAALDAFSTVCGALLPWAYVAPVLLAIFAFAAPLPGFIRPLFPDDAK